MMVPLSQIQVLTPNRYDLGNLKSLADNLAEFGMLHPILVAEESTKDQVPSTNIKFQIPPPKGEISLKAENPNIQTKPDSECNQDLNSETRNPQSAITSSLLPLPSSLGYVLVAGYRRLKAAELLGWTEVPVSIISPSDDLKQFDTSLHENFRRKNLNPLEICDIILERKYRWEKIHGPIKPGPKSTERTTQVELLTNCQKFNLETARILRMCERDIYRFLLLKELDADLRQQVWERTLSYTKAITMQSERKKEQKLAKSRKMSTPMLPDKETAIALQAEYNRSPILFQIMMLVGHIYQNINRFQGKQPEFEAVNPDRLVMLIGRLSAISTWANTLMKEAQETLMKQTGTQIIAEK